ncbi:MAG TPA: Gfo/Idh/MocA family oxidoreductase, partial [Terriglobales bacterium]|nr:Gfo/Idh/MocA family oxidoreductase [Terriglobales bacterium]
MHTLRAALVGLGFVGRAHLDALRRLGIPVRGILSSSPPRTADLCNRLGLDHGYASLDELVSDPEVDVVHICTPNHLHFEQVISTLHAGKHVMCEKPLAMDIHESATLVKLADENNCVGGVAYNLRFYPLCQEARAMVSHGLIGEPSLIHGSFLQDWLLYPTDWNWRLDTRLGGELRAVADIGTHWLDLLTWITDKKVTEVCADLATIVPKRRKPRGRVETFKTSNGTYEEMNVTTDDYGSVLLHFEGEARGVMTVSQVSAGRKTRLWFEIDGSAGSLAWNSESPNTLWIGKRHNPNQELAKDPTLMTPEARGYAAYPGGHPEGYPDTFARLFEDFYKYIAAGDFKKPRTFPTFETGHEELGLCEAMSLSARERRWVSLAAKTVSTHS